MGKEEGRTAERMWQENDKERVAREMEMVVQ